MPPGTVQRREGGAKEVQIPEQTVWVLSEPQSTRGPLSAEEASDTPVERLSDRNNRSVCDTVGWCEQEVIDFLCVQQIEEEFSMYDRLL